MSRPETGGISGQDMANQLERSRNGNLPGTNVPEAAPIPSSSPSTSPGTVPDESERGNAFRTSYITNLNVSADDRKNNAKSYYTYPEGLGLSDGESYVSFRFYEYVPPFTSKNGSSQGRTSTAGYNSNLTKGFTQPAKYSEESGGGELERILLYMPQDIQAQYGVEWGGKSIQNVTAGALSAAGAPGRTLENMLTKLSAYKNTAQGIKDVAITTATQGALSALQAVGQGDGLNINDILGSTRGIVINPNTELLFSGFNLRAFDLNFKLVAQSVNEAKNIQKIISIFKYAMLPSIAQDATLDVASGFIKVPFLVQPAFMLGGKPNEYISQFKQCAITSMNVNYTGEGNFMTYQGGEPVSILLSLSFAETKLVYRDEISTNGGVSF